MYYYFYFITIQCCQNQKKYEGSHKGGKRDGLWTYFYMNGGRQKTKTFKDGLEIDENWLHGSP